MGSCRVLLLLACTTGGARPLELQQRKAHRVAVPSPSETSTLPPCSPSAGHTLRQMAAHSGAEQPPRAAVHLDAERPPCHPSRHRNASPDHRRAPSPAPRLPAVPLPNASAMPLSRHPPRSCRTAIPGPRDMRRGAGPHCQWQRWRRCTGSRRDLG
jgi:hypothetical protein